MMGFRTQTAAYSPDHDGEGASVIELPVVRVTGIETKDTAEKLAVEEPLEIQLSHGPIRSRDVKSISVTMRTPGHDFELAAGFLLTEGVLSDVLDIAEMRYVARTVSPASDLMGTVLPFGAQRNTLRVDLLPGVQVSLSTLERNFYTTSSCGICGKASLLALRAVCPPRIENEFVIDPALLYTFPERLRSAQTVFNCTGGLHAAGLFDSAGALHSLREDVGRHNAVDKLVGAAFLDDRTPLRNRLLMLSGRASFELLQKAVMSGIPMVVSVGAPSSLAVQVAKEFNITLVGFLRDDHFNVYNGAEHLSAHSLQSVGRHP